jgi:hypothetical protein
VVEALYYKPEGRGIDREELVGRRMGCLREHDSLLITVSCSVIIGQAERVCLYGQVK